MGLWTSKEPPQKPRVKHRHRSQTTVPDEMLPLHTEERSGRRLIVGANSTRVRLHCVNWYGAHLRQMVNSGLHVYPMKEIAARIVAMKFNCVRLPYSLDLFLGNFSQVDDAKIVLAADADMQGLAPDQVFDHTVKALTDAQLMVILNNHVSSKMWCCSPWDGEGLWRTDRYPEDVWLQSLPMVARRYSNNTRVIGMDIRNEPRRSPLGYPTWGSDPVADDWSRAAAEGSRLVANANPNMLVFVSAANFPMLLCNVGRNALHTDEILKTRLVYTVHEYAWWSHHWVAYESLSKLLRYLAIVLIASFVCQLATKKRIGATPGRCGAAALSMLGAFLSSVLLFASLVFGQWMKHGCGPETFMGSLLFLYGVPVGMILTSTSCALHLLLLVWFRICPTPDDARRTEFRRIEANGTLEAQILQRDADLTNVVEDDCQAEGQQAEEPCCCSRRNWCRKWLVCTGRAIQVHKAELLFAIVSVAAVVVLEMFRRDLWQYSAFEADVTRRWGFILNGHGDLPPAPVWVGEFGTDKNSMWWQYFTQYLAEQDLDWCYWAFNGEKWLHVGEGYGLLREDWKTLRHPWMLADLHDLIHKAHWL